MCASQPPLEEKKEKKSLVGNEGQNVLPKSLQVRKRPPPYYTPVSYHQHHTPVSYHQHHTPISYHQQHTRYPTISIIPDVLSSQDWTWEDFMLGQCAKIRTHRCLTKCRKTLLVKWECSGNSKKWVITIVQCTKIQRLNVLSQKFILIQQLCDIYRMTLKQTAGNGSVHKFIHTVNYGWCMMNMWI